MAMLGLNNKRLRKTFHSIPVMILLDGGRNLTNVIKLNKLYKQPDLI